MVEVMCISSGNGSWAEWKQSVLGNLKRLEQLISVAAAKEELDRVRQAIVENAKQIGAIQVQIAEIKTELRVKAGLWGAVAGIVAAIITALILKGLAK